MFQVETVAYLLSYYSAITLPYIIYISWAYTNWFKRSINVSKNVWVGEPMKHQLFSSSFHHFLLGPFIVIISM